MKTARIIHENDGHKWIALVRDPERPDFLVDTNEYLVVDGDEGLLLDPGGSEIFPAVFSALSSEFDPRRVSHVFSSHQDPDVISSLSLWLEFNPEMKCYISELWANFVPHFGGTQETFISLPDAGAAITVGRSRLQAIPAHYLHSSGNFHLYDPKAKILFSGDVGAALLPPETEGLFVDDFDRHIRHAEAFHRRWMGSERAKRDWCYRVSQLEIDLLCPQHGAIYQGEHVHRFIDWFDHLDVGLLKG